SRILRWSGIAIGVVLLLLLLSRCFAPAKPVSYATGQVTRGDLVVTISATGNLTPTKQVNVGSEVSGLVDTVLVQNNDRVTKGQQTKANLARYEQVSKLSGGKVPSQTEMDQARAVAPGRARPDCCCSVQRGDALHDRRGSVAHEARRESGRGGRRRAQGRRAG